MEDARAASRTNPCPVVQHIAAIKPNDSDAPLCRVFWESGHTLGIHFSYVTVGDLEAYPYVDPKAFLEQISELGYFHKVLGLPVEHAETGLKQFWETSQTIFPSRFLFDQYVDLHHVIPYYLHGDGGRGFKKDPIEILSMFPALGSGTRMRPVHLSSPKRQCGADSILELGVNLAGNSGSTRFLFSVLSSLVSNNHPEALDALIDL